MLMIEHCSEYSQKDQGFLVKNDIEKACYNLEKPCVLVKNTSIIGDNKIMFCYNIEKVCHLGSDIILGLYLSVISSLNFFG